MAKQKTLAKKKKKSLSKRTVKKYLKKKVPDTHYFVLVTGEKLRNVKELANALGKIDENHYKHHVNDERNDFANWVKDVFGEYDLAEKMKSAKNKNHAQLIIYKHISNNFW